VKFKGPVFPSFKNPPAAHTTQKSYTWRGPHSSLRAALRNLRHACKPILESTDPQVVAQVARVVAMTKDEPTSEFGKLHLIHAAIEACDQTGEPWHVCMKYMLDKFEDIARDQEEAHAAAAAN
jgi:hypothetical protein